MLDRSMRPKFDTEPDDPTDPSLPVPSGVGFRDEPTLPAQTRTVKLAELAPWLDNPPEPPRETRKRDPLLVPVLVFVGLLLIAIGYLLASQPPHH